MKRFALAVLLLACADGASAHSRGTSYSDWTLTAQDAEVRARVSQLELTRLALDPAQAGYADAVAHLLQDHLRLSSASGPCDAGAPGAQVGEDGWVSAHWTLHCADTGAKKIRTTLFLDVAPSHLHFARVTLPSEPPLERVLTSAEPEFAVGAPADLSASFLRYVRLGGEHILSGWDHMAFVLALILLARRLTEVALIATGFTLAHSLTLAAAVLGWASVESTGIEALIGFSIALVAAENLWLRAGSERWLPWTLSGVLALVALLGATKLSPLVLGGLTVFVACYFALQSAVIPAKAGILQPLRLRIAVAFIFGLVHGFGFAGALTPLHLPANRLAAGLVGFNCGVELGQLLVIALVWPLLKMLERKPAARLWAGDLASSAVCALGTFWFVARAFG